MARHGEAAHLQNKSEVSDRRARQLLGQSRRMHRYIAQGLPRESLRAAVREHGYARPRDGYRRVWDAMRPLFPNLGLRRGYRLYCIGGLTMKRKRPKRDRRGERVAMPAATAADHRWSMDFVHDQLVELRCFRVLNIIDDYTREVVTVEVDTSISGH